LRRARETLEKASTEYTINAEELTKVLQGNLSDFEDQFNQMQNI